MLENYTSEENSPKRKNTTWDFPDNGALYQLCLATLLLLTVHLLLCTDLRKMRLDILQIVCFLPIPLELRVVGRKQWQSDLRLYRHWYRLEWEIHIPRLLLTCLTQWLVLNCCMVWKFCDSFPLTSLILKQKHAQASKPCLVVSFTSQFTPYQIERRQIANNQKWNKGTLGRTFFRASQ